MRQSFAEILKSVENGRARKMSGKIPAWAGNADIDIPSDLCLEQCSSQETAEYKASLIGSPAVLADLTGGLGADSWAFSKRAGRVLYFERNSELAEAARSNFAALGIDNITVTCAESDARLIASIPRPDWIYLDPARRDSAGRKVFLLEDCTPDVTELLPAIWERTDNLMIKLSPMADISLIAGQLGCRLKEVHVVGAEGEAKELLCILSATHDGGYTITAALPGTGTEPFTFRPEEEAGATFRQGCPEKGGYLLEPCATLLKSGAFKLACSRFGIGKLAAFTHLYCSSEPVFSPFFKTYRILDTADLGNASAKRFSKDFPQADVTARNIPMTSEQLRVKLKCAPSNDGTHIFGCTAGLTRMLIACRRISSI